MHGRAPPPVEVQSWDVDIDNRDFNRLDNRQEPNSQYGRGQAANQGTGGLAPALVKVEVLCKFVAHMVVSCKSFLQMLCGSVDLDSEWIASNNNDHEPFCFMDE
ncbi:MIF4G domain-containing protein / MA3 domain-containing protein [Artemisia annua]|uniref:MIF4G domain-containing protein / MA3 domain-containing protein n=1 Tax=Artemisia annua TaxID=35608 RepID=A0A2U1MZI2_ARTAN|nr:MIF4G domain-containing protein / MA3 domain-containing protein [Artemisia annua]